MHRVERGGEMSIMEPDMTDPWVAYSRDLGRNLQAARIRVGLTQERVALGAGISTFTYQKMENGESNPGTPSNPRLQTLLCLSVVLEEDLCRLLPRPSITLEKAVPRRSLL